MVLNGGRQKTEVGSFFFLSNIKYVNLPSLPGINFSTGVSRPNEFMTMGSLCQHTALVSHCLS